MDYNVTLGLLLAAQFLLTPVMERGREIDLCEIVAVLS